MPDQTRKETGPLYGTVELIDSLPVGGGMKQAMPSRRDLERAMRDHKRLVGGYEVLLAHYRSQAAELAELRAVVERRREEIIDEMVADVRVNRIEFPDADGGMSVVATSPLVVLMAHMAKDTLEEHGAENFLTQSLDFRDPDGLGPGFVVTIQRKTGKTPEEKYMEACRKIRELESALAAKEASRG